MMAPEDYSLQRRFRYLEWAAIVLTAGAQLAWTIAAVKFDLLVALSFIVLACSSILTVFTPGTTRWRFIQLIGQTLLILVASALGAHHFYYLNLYVLAAKAALLLPRMQMLIVAAMLIIGHFIAGQFASYALHDIHVKLRPEPRYYRSIILEGQALLYFIIGLITVTVLGRTLIAERKSRLAELSLSEQVERLAVRLARARIARDIHDGLGHTLTSLRVQLELVLKLLEEDERDKALELLLRCQDSAHDSLLEVRRAVKTEKDGELDLKHAVSELVDQINQQGSLTFDIKMDDITLPLTLQHQIFSIIQECLTNVRKHASADRVEIELNQKDGLINLSVRDNGHGFDVRSKHSGFGIKGLRERAQSIGGKILIESEEGKGTEIVICVPPKDQCS